MEIQAYKNYSSIITTIKNSSFFITFIELSFEGEIERQS